MTAKEMFEKQGFSYRLIGNEIECFLKSDITNWCCRINFYLVDKSYSVRECDDYALIDMDIHKAINKQLEELGWI